MQSSFVQTGVITCLAVTLLSAPLAFFAGKGAARRLGSLLLILGTGVGAFSGAAALALKSGSVELPVLTAALGVNLELTALSAVFFAAVNLVACLAAIYSLRYVEESADLYHAPSLNGVTGLFIFGMQATLLATSVLGFMVSWEIMSLSSFALVMADRSAASRKAAMLYFVMAHIGAMAIMAGFFIVAGGDPLAGFSALSANAATLTPRQTLAAFILFFIGFGSKAGLVPLHTWLPEAHPQAPSHVSALMSGVMLKVAVYGFIVTCMTIIPGLPPAAALAVMGIGLLSAVFGALHAAVDVDIKRTLAWSSVENLGVIFLMLGTAAYARTQGLEILANIAFAAALFHCVAHAVFKSGLFLSAGAIAHAAHTRSLERMGGLAKRMPVLSASFLALALAGAALPPFAGFIGEWMYLSGLVGALPGLAPGTQAILVMALVGTAFTAGIAVFAMVKLFAISQLGAPRSHGAEAAHDPAAAIRMPVVALAALAALLGAAAPRILGLLGSGSLVSAPSAIAVPGATLSTAALTAAVLGALLLVWAAKRFFGSPKERVYQTWDCGQPITAQMEYTATAFSAPIRFFFRNFVGIRKTVVAVPASPSSSLVMQREMTVTGRSFWISYIYEPLARVLHGLGDRVRRIQSGSIQLYLLFILIALAATLIIAV
ncbi:MAG TPA: proton-conducting transporter membrane subunit [Candidatus Eisenbacteria bacterium]|nr:proton-conducting transporter membrane subunit [Candidatus Eisenbacteria bacterium]